MEAKHHRTKQYMELMPVLLLFLNMLVYAYFILTNFNVVKNFDLVFLIGRHLFETSLSGLFVLWSISKEWKSFSKNCLKLLTIYWMFNTPYILLQYPPDLYHMTCSLLTYAIFVTLIIKYVLTRR